MWSDFAQAGADAEVDAADAAVGVLVQRVHHERVHHERAGGCERYGLEGLATARGREVTATPDALAFEPDEASHTVREPGCLDKEGLSGCQGALRWKRAPTNKVAALSGLMALRRAAHGFSCGSRPLTPPLARWVPPRDEDRPMAGKGVDSMAIKPVVCNGPISAAHVHWAGFDLEARAARENMLALGATRTAADRIEGGSKGTEQGLPACGRVGRGVCRDVAIGSAGKSGSQGRPGVPSTRDAKLDGGRTREIMVSRFEGSVFRQKESKSTTPPQRERPEGSKPESLWLTRPRLEQRKTLRIYVVHR